MKRIVLQAGSGRRLPFYLAAEEWVARNLPAADYFFLWRVAPTVICGRNQDMAAEVNLPYCREHGIDVVRRRSGGGCVYADMNNWMISYITGSGQVETTFSRFTSTVARMLQSLGLDAAATGRNDILIGGRKVSGNAFYHLPGRAIAHGTMLHRIDRTTLSQAITPSRAKIQSKAVQSVESRVTSLSEEGLDMSVEEFGRYAERFLSAGDGDVVLSPDDICGICEIERGYYDPAFLPGRHATPDSDSRGSDIVRRRRIEGVGEFSVGIGLDGGTVRSIVLSGDYFVTGDTDAITAPLLGLPYSRPALCEAVSRLRPEAVIAGLNRRELLSLLI